MGTLAVSLFLAAMFALAVRSIYKQKKAGGCGCGCSGCSGSCGNGSVCSCGTMQQPCAANADDSVKSACQHS